MANLTVCYPGKYGSNISIYAIDVGEIFEWENDFWIMTSAEGIVSLTRGEWLPLTIFETKDKEDILLLNDARLYPYGNNE